MKHFKIEEYLVNKGWRLFHEYSSGVRLYHNNDYSGCVVAVYTKHVPLVWEIEAKYPYLISVSSQKRNR